MRGAEQSDFFLERGTRFKTTNERRSGNAQTIDLINHPDAGHNDNYFHHICYWEANRGPHSHTFFKK